ncbi:MULTISPECIES: flagellar protein FliT [Pseudomonas]|uniref:Flagellar protein FliT n=1 Tax=Serpens gallinarum TaxID=2763075 RepID=A0ABR8TS86_9PSED|nr:MULTISPECIES: flagellar protein FliT [Pseudomonas]MBD7978345.1 flagellar protein FliT [Serpens gallinarum]MBF0676242.1 flagellar protein FliT [Pseudomonas sp.]
MQEAIKSLESARSALREALERQDWNAIGELDSMCRAVVDEVMAQGAEGGAELVENLGELLELYREVLEACEKEKQQVGSELRQLHQSTSGVKAYQASE